MGDLGKIMLTNGGAWNSATEYEPLTMVRHNKASYCSTQNSIGQEPSEESEYWQLISKDGNEVTVDSELNETSKNPVQNKAVHAAITNITENYVQKVDRKGLSTNDYTTTEKNKLAGIATGANKTTVDSALSSSSTNPVQNKVVYAAIKSLGAPVLIQDTEPSDKTALWVK